MKNNIYITAQIIALLSFVIGTSILSLYLYFGEDVIDLVFAFGFVVLTVTINIIIFTVVIGAVILNKSNRKEGIITCLLMILNIPIAVLYLFMVITFPSHQILL